MEAKKYIEAVAEYPPEDFSESFELSRIMTEARKWSTFFGNNLFDYCNGQFMPKYDKQLVENYYEWVETHLASTNEALEQNIHLPEYQKAYSELNFHYLNIAMIEQWRAIFGINSTPQDRVKNIKFAQDYLSIVSLDAFCKKLDQTKPGNEPEYFSYENKIYRDLTENRLNEIDSAIVILEAIKRHPSLHALPSPALFEKYTDRSNADFIVIDTNTNDILGIQTKTTIFSKELERYDSDRIIFIDGRYDLENTKMMRTLANSSRLKEVSWNGLIAMHHLKTMNPKKISSAYISSVVTTKELIKDMMRARSALGSTKMNLPKITGIIENRILNNLYK